MMQSNGKRDGFLRVKSFHISQQGAGHIKKQKECQDASESYSDDQCSIAIVCDGHGGDDYVRSAIGAGFACAAAEENIKNFLLNVDKDIFMQNEKQREGLLKQLEAGIINTWNNLVNTHFSQNPFTQNEMALLSCKAQKRYFQNGQIESAYGTTLIVAVMTPSYWFGLHIGDGKCITIEQDGNFYQPIPWDPKCFLNATTSICDSDAINNFRHFYSENLPVAIFLGSDGIDDCFRDDEQLNYLYKTVICSFSTTNFDEAVNELRDYLPRLSAKGSNDDVSVSAILDLDEIYKLPFVQEYIIREEQTVQQLETDVVTVSPDTPDELNGQEMIVQDSIPKQDAVLLSENEANASDVNANENDSEKVIADGQNRDSII